MRYGYDIDGVLANWAQAALDYSRRYLPQYQWKKHWTQIDNWNGYTNSKEAWAEFWDRIRGDIGFWLSIRPFDDAHLHTKVDLYLTSRPVPSEVSRAWLQTYRFPEAEVVTVDQSHKKRDVVLEKGIDIFVDDKPSTVRQMLDLPTTLPLLRHRPHNRDCSDLDAVRVHCLSEVPLIEKHAANGSY